MATEILLTDANLPLPEEFDLTSWAASEAAKVLRNHWNDALHDGMRLTELITDIDDTIRELQAWRQTVRRLAEKGV